MTDRGTIAVLTRPGFDRDDTSVLDSIALSGPGRVSNDLGSGGGLFMSGRPRRSPEERRKLFWSRVDKAGPLPDYRPDLGQCWVWKGGGGGGYGLFWDGDTTRGAHRIAYEELVGPIPEGAELDHLCRVRTCVRPDHTEPVDHQVNTTRGVSFVATNAVKSVCAHGHTYDLLNTYVNPRGSRECRICMRDRVRRWEERRRAESA